MAIDYIGAKKAGYTNDEISTLLQNKGLGKIDIEGVQKAGYNDSEINTLINTKYNSIQQQVVHKKNLLETTDFSRKPEDSLPQNSSEDTHTSSNKVKIETKKGKVSTVPIVNKSALNDEDIGVIPTVKEAGRIVGYNLAKHGAAFNNLIGDKEQEALRRGEMKEFEKSSSILSSDSEATKMVAKIGLDPLTYTPVGIFNKGKKAWDIAKSTLAGGAIGAGLTAEDQLGTTGKIDMTSVGFGAGLGASINALLSTFTRGKVHGAIPENEADAVITDVPKAHTPKHDEEIASVMNKEYAPAYADVPKVPAENPPEGLANDINVATKVEEVDPKIAKAKAEQDARTQAAHEEAMARKAQLEAEEAHKTDVDTIESHPRLQELIELRRDVSAKESARPNIHTTDRQIIHENNGSGYETTVIPAMDSKNYNHDFALTQADIKAYEKNGITPALAEKFKKDLDVLDNDPVWAKVDEKPLDDFTVDKDGNPLDADGNQLFVRGADNVAVGMIAGIDKDENGNITFDPEKFVIGLGGYTAVKALAKNPTVQKELREYAQRALNELDTKPHRQYLTGEIPLFAGERARGADTDILAKAKAAIEKGEDAKAVWKDTGWIKDKDGKWKFEIDDSQAVMKVPARVKHSANEMDKYLTMMKKDPENPNVLEAYNEAKVNYMRDLSGGEYTLSDILDHNQLYRNYPTMKEMRVVFDDTMTNGGSYNPKSGTITLPTDHLVFPDISPLLHEIQHGVQGVEKFATGGSYQTVTPKQLSETLEKQYGYLPSYQKLDEEFLAGKIPSEEELYIKKVNLGMNSYGGIDKLKYDTYKRLHGETEARNVQARIDMDDTARREAFPHDTMDVDVKETNIRFDKESSDMSEDMRKRYMNGDRVNIDKLKADADQLPQPIATFKDFRKQFEVDKNGNTIVDSKNGVSVSFNVRGAFKHFEPSSNTHYDDRTILSGAFLPTLKEPLAIVKQPHNNREVIFYRPFIDEKNNIYNLAAIKFTDGKFTYFNLTEIENNAVGIQKVKAIIEGTEGNELYFKHGGKGTLNEHTASIDDVAQSSNTESVLQSSNDVKSASGFYSVAQKAIDAMPNKMDTEAFIKYLKNNGVKDDEILHSGIAKAIEGKTSITKDEIVGVFSNPVMEKKVLGEVESPLVKEYDDLYELISENPTKYPRGSDEYTRWEELSKQLTPEQIGKEYDGSTKYQDYSLKGVGENYREELTTLSKDFADPTELKALNKRIEEIGIRKKEIQEIAGGNNKEIPDEYKPEWKALWNETTDLVKRKSEIGGHTNNGYSSSHWSEPNVLLHTRKQDTVIDGDKTLLVEEIQSDWHQAGRKKGYQQPEKPIDTSALDSFEVDMANKYGFEYTDRATFRKQFLDLASDKEVDLFSDIRAELANQRRTIESNINKNAIPQAPMSKTWHEYGMRQIIDEAVAKGYDRVAWVDGTTQAQRYAMSHSVDRLVYNKQAGVIQGFKDGQEVMYKSADESELEHLIGKEPAKRLMDNEVHSGIHEIKGEALDIGGDGMKGFYDKILVDYAKKYTKKWGTTVEKKALPNGTEVHTFPVTQKMREDVSKNGQALYANGIGAMAGIETDENGNIVGFDPVKALVGVAGGSILLSKSVRNQVSKLVGKTEHLSDSAIQGLVRTAIKTADIVTAGSLTKIANTLKESAVVDYVIGHKIYKLKDYMKLREDALRASNAGMEQAARLHLQLSELSSEAREAMYAYMSGEKNVALTPELKKAADTFITKIDDMGQKMVDEGFLSKEAYEEWQGQYLHRRYASKIKQASDWASGKGEFAVDKVQMRGKQWKGDGHELQKLIDEGFEIAGATDGLFKEKSVSLGKAIATRIGASDKDILTSMGSKQKVEIKDLAQKRLEQYKVENEATLFTPDAPKIDEEKLLKQFIKDERNNYVKSKQQYSFRRDWTKEERTSMGEIRDIAYSLPETVGRLAQMTEFGKMLKAVPKKYLLDQGSRSDVVMRQLGYEKLTGSRYGALNGQWVNSSIASDLKRVSNDVLGEEHNVKKLWNDYVSAVKMTHTIYNPTAHVNNIGSNIFLQGAAGLNPLKAIKYATDGTLASRRYGRWKELDAKRVTGLGADESAELAKIEADTDVQLWKSLDERKMFGRSQLNEILRTYMSPSIDTKAGSMVHKASEAAKALYQGEDDVMRFAAVKQLTKDGIWTQETAGMTQKVMSIDEAMKHANDHIIPDYSKPMSKLALTLRDSGLVPFMSWTYYSTPILLSQLRNNPTRVLAIAAAWYGMDRLMGVDPYNDETMPKGFDAQRVAIARDGNKVTGMRVSSMIPHIQLAQPENTYLEPLTSGIPQTILGAATNYNFYFRKPITYKDGGEGAYQRFTSAWQNVLPSPDVIDKAYNLVESKLLDKETRRKDRVIEPRTTAQEAMSFFVNLQTYDVAKQREKVRKDKIRDKKTSHMWDKKVDKAMNKLQRVFQ